MGNKNMNWKEKIKEGIKLIKEGCKEKQKGNKCIDCPFNEYCTFNDYVYFWEEGDDYVVDVK